MKSIKSRFILAIALLMLFSLGTLGLLNYWNASKVLLTETETGLTTLANSSAEDLAHWISIRKAEVEVSANSPAVDLANRETSLGYLTQERNRTNTYLRFFMADSNGNAFFTDGAKSNVAFRDYFVKAMTTGQTIAADPVIAQNNSRPVMVIASPIKQAGKPIGILGATITLEDMINRVSAITCYESGYAFVIQRDGLIIMHPDKEQALKVNLLTDDRFSVKLKEAANKMIQGDRGFSQYEDNGIAKYVAYAPIVGTNWILAISVPAEEVNAKLRDYKFTSLITSLIILIFAGLTGYYYSVKMAKPIQALSVAAGRIAQGDLSSLNISINSNDELGQLAKDFSQMTANLRMLIKNVLDVSEQLAAASQELTAGASQSSQTANQIAVSITKLAEGAQHQHKAVDMTFEVVKMVSNEIRLMTDAALNVSEITDKTSNAATDGYKSVELAISQMNNVEEAVSNSAKVVEKLDERSWEIGRIVDTISAIAEQTNLLALNAAIEAARAGEQGRGFAVVAEEVRKLAEQSHDSAKEIASLIGEIQTNTKLAMGAMNNGTKEVKKGTDVVNTAGQALLEIFNSFELVSKEIHEINSSIQQLSQNSQQIVDSVETIDKVSKSSLEQTETVAAATEEQSASINEIAISSESLSRLAQDLHAVVSKFKI